MLYKLIRPLLFKLPPETAHYLVCNILLFLNGCKLLPKIFPASSQKGLSFTAKFLGLEFKNRIGLAAGFDKNGDYIDVLASLGFGFIEIGTVTPKAQPGNPKPRLFRLPKAQALINRMGFNNKGVDYLIEQVKKCQYRGVLGINIGKNATTPLEKAVDDYLYCLSRVYPYASYITINISSPNTAGLRSLQNKAELNKLLSALKSAQTDLAKQHAKYVPLLVKIAPDLTEEEIKDLAEILIEQGMDGVIATNTTLSRQAVQGMPHAEEIGGLSGAPVFPLALKTVAGLQKSLQGRIPIIACGGIQSVKEAQAMLAAGASLLQIYTGFIYQGPELIGRLLQLKV